MTDGQLHVAVGDGIAVVTLSRPEKRNALTQKMLRELLDVMAVLRSRDDVRAVVVEGEGHVFSAGADLVEFRALRDDAERRQWVALGRRAFDALAESPAPVIIAIDGGAFGGGVELALHGDLRILGTDAVLALPEVSLGWSPEWGGLERLPQIVTGSRALQMVLTGMRVSASDAVSWGLVNEVCDSPGARARELAKSLAAIPPDVIGQVLPPLRQRWPADTREST
jgi:enoyl-CoA hydratase/carnithine racemase